jgi:cell division septation protein DedD
MCGIYNKERNRHRRLADAVSVVFKINARNEVAAESIKEKVTLTSAEDLTKSMVQAGANVVVVNSPSAVIQPKISKPEPQNPEPQNPEPRIEPVSPTSKDQADAKAALGVGLTIGWLLIIVAFCYDQKRNGGTCFGAFPETHALPDERAVGLGEIGSALQSVATEDAHARAKNY